MASMQALAEEISGTAETIKDFLSEVVDLADSWEDTEKDDRPDLISSIEDMAGQIEANVPDLRKLVDQLMEKVG